MTAWLRFLEVYVYRHICLYAEVSSHGVIAMPVRGIDILQAAEVTLVNLVEQVLATYRQFYAVMSEQVQVHSCRQIEHGIVWRSRFRIINCIIMILSEVIFHVGADERPAA